MRKWLIAAGVLASAIALAQVFRFPQGGTGSPGPYATGSRICSDGNKFVTCPPSPSATNTPTNTPTATASNTPTITPTATVTNTPTVTPTNTPTPTVTNTPISSSTIDETLWQKSYFVNNSLLPTTAFKDSVSTFPAAGWTTATTHFSWSSDLAYTKAVAASAVNGNNARYGWDIGAAKTVVLALVGGMGYGGGGTTGQQAIIVTPDDPTGGGCNNWYAFYFENNNSRFTVYKTNGSCAFTSIGSYGSSSLLYPPQHADAYPMSAALRVDGSGHTVMGFIRANGGQWIRLFNISDSSLTSFRYVFLNAAATANETADHWFAAPVEIWYTN